MAKEIIWTPEAENSFEEIINYLQKHWGARVLQRFIERVNIVIRMICREPFIYRSSGKENVREALITKHNLLLYRVSGETIYILYFWDTRKNPSTKPLPE